MILYGKYQKTLRGGTFSSVYGMNTYTSTHNDADSKFPMFGLALLSFVSCAVYSEPHETCSKFVPNSRQKFLNILSLFLSTLRARITV